MAEIVACPKCQRQLQVPESYLGQTVQCPECQHQFEAIATSGAVQTVVPIPVGISSKRKTEEPDEPEDRPRRRRRFDEEDEDDDYRPISRRRNYSPHRGSLIFTLGILSIFVMPLILGTVAWVLGNADLRAIHNGDMDPEGESQTRTGRNIGMVMVCLHVALLVFVVLFFAIMIASGNMH